MKWVSIKSASDVKLEGIKVDIEQVNNSLSAVIFTDAKGHTCKIVLQSYSMLFVMPEPPKLEDRWLVAGKYDGDEMRKLFDDEYTAREFKNKMDVAFGNDTFTSIS